MSKYVVKIEPVNDSFLWDSDEWKTNVCADFDENVVILGPMDRSPPGSSVHGIFQAKVLEWGAIAFSDGAVDSSHLSNDRYFVEQQDLNILVHLEQKILVVPLFS